MEFKDRLKELRNDINISAVELSECLNKSESAIRMWESGKTKPDADTLVELSKILKCSIDYLLGVSDYRNIAESKEAELYFNETEIGFNKLDVEYKSALLKLLSLSLKHIEKANQLFHDTDDLFINSFMKTIDGYNRIVSECISCKNDLDNQDAFINFILSFSGLSRSVGEFENDFIEAIFYSSEEDGQSKLIHMLNDMRLLMHLRIWKKIDKYKYFTHLKKDGETNAKKDKH